jgi:hypothetical protein
MKKIILRIALAISLLGVLCIAAFIIMVATFAGEFPPPPTKTKIIGEFTKHKEYFYEIKNYFLFTGYKNISLDSDSEIEKIDFMSVTDDNDVRKKIQIHENMKESIQFITKDCKYADIDLEDGAIYFQRWAGLRYKAKGIAFTINGNPPGVYALVYYEQLNEPNWYYYEINYAEWRVNH